MQKLITIATVLFLTSACAIANGKAPDIAELPNKEKAQALIESIETGDPKPVGYIN